MKHFTRRIYYFHGAVVNYIVLYWEQYGKSFIFIKRLIRLKFNINSEKISNLQNNNLSFK